MDLESMSNQLLSDSTVRVCIDRGLGIVEVHLANSMQEVNTFHIAYFLDRVTKSRWGDASDETPLTKPESLEHFRSSPGWGDAPKGVICQEVKTLERLAATPVWDSAIVVAKLLAKQALLAQNWRPSHILELGAGLGIPGFLAAHLWPEANVALTECSDSLVELLRRNLCVNFAGCSHSVKRPRSGRTLLACDLSFGAAAADAALEGHLKEFDKSIDLVIATDCFFHPWYGDTWSPLRETLLRICTDQSCVVLSTKRREGGRVGQALEHVVRPPFYGKLVFKIDGQCDVCNGEGYVDCTCCWKCEGMDSKEESEEVWLLSKSESALSSWVCSSTKSCPRIATV